MAGSGHAGRGRPNDHVLQDAGDRDLFHQQHPYTPPPPPPRFSSPSRPPRRTSDRFTSLAYGSAVSTLVQAAVWVALSVLAIALYYNYLSVTDPGEQQRWSDWAYIIVNLYFNAKGALPSLPSEGLATPSQMQLLAMGTLAANGLMLVMSVFLLIGLGCCSRPGAVLTVVVTWALSVVVVTAADVVVAAAMVRDLLLLEGWNEWPGDYNMLRLCPGAVLALALRGGVLLLANVVCMLLVLRRLHEHRKQAGSAVTNDAPQTATTKDGPIDGFLYPPNGDREGVLNPVFVPDDAQQQQQHWTTFKPEQQRGGQRANGHSGHDLGFNPNNRHDLGFNPNNRHDLGFNPNNRHDLGFNPNNRHDLGFNPNNRHDLGFNPNNRHDLGFNPNNRHDIGYNGNNRHDLGYNGNNRHDLGMDDPEDTSHLMWMEEVDKHVDVHVRRGEAEDRQDRPPQHHRHGFVEERQPQPQPQPRRRVDEQRVDEHFPSGRFRAASGTPLNPGALPVGYPEPGLGLGLARVPLTPTSYRPPSLPPVDYSPPARRRGAGAAEQALVAGRAGLRPVNQERF